MNMPKKKPPTHAVYDEETGAFETYKSFGAAKDAASKIPEGTVFVLKILGAYERDYNEMSNDAD